MIDLAHVSLDFSRTQEVYRSESSCVAWFPYLFAKRAVERVKVFTELGRK